MSNCAEPLSGLGRVEQSARNFKINIEHATDQGSDQGHAAVHVQYAYNWWADQDDGSIRAGRLDVTRRQRTGSA
jgi:hypothetical protein